MTVGSKHIEPARCCDRTVSMFVQSLWRLPVHCFNQQCSIFNVEALIR